MKYNVDEASKEDERKKSVRVDGIVGDEGNAMEAGAENLDFKGATVMVDGIYDFIYKCLVWLAPTMNITTAEIC